MRRPRSTRTRKVTARKAMSPQIQAKAAKARARRSPAGAVGGLARKKSRAPRSLELKVESSSLSDESRANEKLTGLTRPRYPMTPPTAVVDSSVVPAGAARKNYMITQLDAVPAVPCPCGHSRRGFATPDNKLATIHLVDISIDA